MADRYQDRPFPDEARGGDPRGSGRSEGDPLAELARLIGQTDPFGNMGRGNPKAPPRTAPPRNQYQPPEAPDDASGGARPPWIQRANRQEVPREMQRETPRELPREVPREASREATIEAPSEAVREVQRQVPREAEAEDYAAPAHLLNRYGAQHPEPAQDHQDYQQEPPFDEAEGEPDPSRYDDALYGQIGSGVQNYQRQQQGYSDDPFGYQDDYEEEEEEQGGRRRGGLKTVAAVLVLAVLGGGAALGYRAYFTSSRSGEPPIIRADNSPTKVVPPADAKVPDRLASSDGSERIVPREEAPVDINTRAVGPRVVFPALNQNSNPPPPSDSPGSLSATSPVVVLPSSSGTMPSSEPRRVKTVPVRGDQQADSAAAPVSAPPSPPPAPPRSAARTPRNSPNSANASANGPLSLSPQSADSAPPPTAAPRARVAATTNPVQTEPDSGAASSGSSGGFMVQVSSQPSEGVAQASYRTLQTKFPAVLGGHDAVIKRAELGDKIVYRAMVGPFGSREEALQLCTSLKSAGGQCFVPRN